MHGIGAGIALIGLDLIIQSEVVSLPLAIYVTSARQKNGMEIVENS